MTLTLKGGLGLPLFDEGLSAVLKVPCTCQACGHPLHPIGWAPATEGITVRVVFECSNMKCPGLWMFTGSMRAMKTHELDRVYLERERRRGADSTRYCS